VLLRDRIGSPRNVPDTPRNAPLNGNEVATEWQRVKGRPSRATQGHP
jgi:hypothetical protein